MLVSRWWYIVATLCSPNVQLLRVSSRVVAVKAATAERRGPGELSYLQERQEVSRLKGKPSGLEDSCSLAWGHASLPGRRPAATGLHVHCPAAGVEVRWVGLSGKWPRRGGCPAGWAALCRRASGGPSAAEYGVCPNSFRHGDSQAVALWLWLTTLFKLSWVARGKTSGFFFREGSDRDSSQRVFLFFVQGGLFNLLEQKYLFCIKQQKQYSWFNKKMYEAIFRSD